MYTDIHDPLPQVSTLSGEVSLLAPDPAQINFRDVITSLKHENRYGGHSIEPVSVLQHSLLVWLFAYTNGKSFEEQRRALWHDATEAYVKDLPRPLKKHLGQVYTEIEQRFAVAVGTALGVDIASATPAWLKEYDNLALAVECGLYRPATAYSDWLGLPKVTAAHTAIARGAERAARLIPAEIIYLDRCLQSGNVPGVTHFVTRILGKRGIPK
jgi:uncharacterized protein